MQVYLRKLNTNELAFRTGVANQAGRFIYISKRYVHYFPHLSRFITNDSLLLSFIPPFSNSIVYSNFVYHNDKFTVPDGSRNEYRLYLNSILDPNADYFKVNDILVIQKIKLDAGRIIYKIYRYVSSDNPYEYNILNNILAVEGINGTHALVDLTRIPFIQKDYSIKEEKIEIPEEVRDEALKLPIKQIESSAQAYESLTEEIIEEKKLIKRMSFKDFVLFLYENKCAVSGNNIIYKDLTTIEAAHIKPIAHGGPMHPTNGIALSRDLHRAFDKGMFTITDDYKVLVHDKMKGDPFLKDYDGKRIFLPKDERARPDQDFLKYHRNNIFGLFADNGVTETPESGN